VLRKKQVIRTLVFDFWHGPLAQWFEQRTHNPLVNTSFQSENFGEWKSLATVLPLFPPQL
jgi:hypothetical protein